MQIWVPVSFGILGLFGIYRFFGTTVFLTALLMVIVDRRRGKNGFRKVFPKNFIKIKRFQKSQEIINENYNNLYVSTSWKY